MGDITDMDLRQMIGEKMSKEMDKNIEVVEKTDTGVIVFDKPYNLYIPFWIYSNKI